MRLNKFLAERLGFSRREADDLIAAGKVKINDKVATLGDRVDKNDKVWYNDKVVPIELGYTYVALNKPAGYLCSRRSQGEAPTVYEILPPELAALKTVGRLDKDSSGLILLSNDGDFAFRMTHPKFAKTKEYRVRLLSALEPLHQQMIADFGIEIGDGISRLGLTRLSDDRREWLVTMSEGRNRQIRRTFAALGYNIGLLQRISFGPYQLGDLKPGEWREVTKV